MKGTETEEGRSERLGEIVREYEKSGNKRAIIRLIGGSIDDLGDYTPADAGEAPSQEEDYN